ncbi:MAG TPA: DNA translocase FtsK 4TM domain-containing protein [Ilumatobacteraceae bacterium]|nr:DNA translocase FtsK 4TM domain-containing protein [Ilumatobacteraceae bacterium]
MGQPNKRSKTTTTAKRAPAKAAPKAAASSPASSTSGRGKASQEIRQAMDGREHEFAGIGFIAVGVLLGLAIYLDLAGPLGRGVETVVGWLTGLGRYVVPVALIAIGAALVGKGQSLRRSRLALGWGLLGLSLLGLLHVVRGPEKIMANFDTLGRAGGWIGALVGEPLRSLIASGGAIVVLVAACVGGALILTGASLRTMLSNTGKGVGAVAVPIGRKARTAFGNVSTLKSDRQGSGELPMPTIYDAALDEDWDEPATPRKPKAPRTLPAPGSLDPGLVEQSELELGPGAQRGQWVLPPANYLNKSTQQTINKAEVEARGRTLVDALTSHGVETKLLGQTVGPTVTRYELELGSGVKVARVTSLNRDIAYAMAATDVRILAPIPGRTAIGVEVPNHTRQLVSLGDIMSSPESKTASHPLDVAIGKDIAGRSVFLNLATTPHLLIAGTTGAGKSSGLNCILTSILMRSTPDQVRLILIDPKQVEMGQYNRLPHLLTQPVTNPKKAANALGWAVKEMERRYDLLFEVGFRDIAGYNAAYDRGELKPEPGSERVFERLPYILVVVDELNDLMMVAARDVEESITRIAQKARAVGVHLIVATQRPSVNVITGVIKANIPARAAYAVNSLTDSRVILDQPGAEKLVGKGDMLLLPGNSNVSQRIQGSFVSEEEVRKVVAHWRRQAPEVVYVSGVEGDDDAAGGASMFSSGSGDDDEDDTLMRQAMELVVRSQLGSTSMLQRKLKVGFARAGRIMDLLEQSGVVGPSEGSKARSVLMTVEEFELLQQAQRGREA